MPLAAKMSRLKYEVIEVELSVCLPLERAVYRPSSDIPTKLLAINVHDLVQASFM